MLGKLHIAVAGCGPGGLATALFLKRLGHDVTLFEQFAEPLPVGSGLLIQPSGQTVLERLGLLEKIRSLASPVQRLNGISVGKGRRALDMQYAYTGDRNPALGIHRASLFSILLDAVSTAGIAIVVNSKLSAVENGKGWIRPVFENGTTGATFDLLIDACGARSPVAGGKVRRLDYGAIWATVDMPAMHAIMPAALDQRYFRASQMAGIMPIGRNPATGNLGAAVFWSEKPENAGKVMEAGIERFQENYCDLWPEAASFVSQLSSTSELNLALYSHRTGVPSSNERLFHVGDSWHCTSPQLGQGANMALIDAAALALALEKSASLSQARENYRKARMTHIRLYQTLSVLFTPLYQSDSLFKPWARDIAIHHFARLPLVRQFVAKTVSGNLALPQWDATN